MKGIAISPDRGFVRHVVRALLGWLRDSSVEQHYSAETLAALLEVTPRTIWNYVELGESTQGREGIYPVVKLSHKVVRIPASSAARLLKSRIVATAVRDDQDDERRVA